MRYLGVDYGTKKVGLALSDEGGNMGFPYAVIPHSPRLVEDLAELIARERIGTVILGESRSLAGGENPIAHEARALGEALAARARVPVFYESEVYTSAEARRSPGGKEEKTRRPKQRPPVDAAAAALILTSYLSRHHGA